MQNLPNSTDAAFAGMAVDLHDDAQIVLSVKGELADAVLPLGATLLGAEVRGYLALRVLPGPLSRDTHIVSELRAAQHSAAGVVWHEECVARPENKSRLAFRALAPEPNSNHVNWDMVSSLSALRPALSQPLASVRAPSRTSKANLNLGQLERGCIPRLCVLHSSSL